MYDGDKRESLHMVYDENATFALSIASVGVGKYGACPVGAPCRPQPRDAALPRLLRLVARPSFSRYGQGKNKNAKSIKFTRRGESGRSAAPCPPPSPRSSAQQVPSTLPRHSSGSRARYTRPPISLLWSVPNAAAWQ